VYVVLFIALVGFILTWPPLRRYTRIWIQRPITIRESLVAGIAAWISLFSVMVWFSGIVLTCIDFLSTHNNTDIWVITLSLLLTGSVLNFLIQSRSETGLDDTQDFFKEAIQFRRSEQRRLDLLSLMQQGRKHRKKRAVNDSESRQRERLQANLDKEKELDTQITRLREGTLVDLSEVWHSHARTHSTNPLYEKVQEARIDPTKKRLSLFADFPELNEELLKDETTVLRFNRQVYDFFQSMNAEPWLKSYAPFFESYYLMCRATKKNLEGTELLYPFMKVGAMISELHKLEGSYFNPRKLSEIASLAFNNGGQV
jgi:hypothetical protein